MGILIGLLVVFLTFSVGLIIQVKEFNIQSVVIIMLILVPIFGAVGLMIKDLVKG